MPDVASVCGPAFDQLLGYYAVSGRSGCDEILSKFLLRKASILEETGRFEDALKVYEEYIGRFYPPAGARPSGKK